MSKPSSPDLGRGRQLAWALAIFAVLFVVYQANVSELDEGDAVPSVNLPVAVLADRRLSFDPIRFPEMFKWRSRPPFVSRQEFGFTTFTEVFGDRTAWEWLESKHLELNGPRYYLVESRRKGVYVSVFGPIPGLLLLPVMAPFFALDPLLFTKPALRDAVAKVAASGLVAACAALLFLISARQTTKGRALLVAAAYGLGSCAWAVSSQNMWQQTVTQALLTAGAFFLLRGAEDRSNAGLSGFFFGAAAACRPTAAIPFALVLAYLVARHRRSVVPFLLASLPIPLTIGVYNAYYFGSPLTFAQELVGHDIALEKTGSRALFQTPLWKGALGLLASPSRGVLFYSPVLVPSLWGLVRAFRAPDYRAFRPLGVAALLMMAVQCKWFDWWGGHAYGYRPWLDVAPYLALFLLPVVSDLTQTLLGRAAFGAALAWSMFVQALGAFSYDRSWNVRELHVVELPNVSKPLVLYDENTARRFAADHGGAYVGHAPCDVDRPWCRYRLWSFSDNPIFYHLAHFRETRARRSREGFRLLLSPEAKEAKERGARPGG